MRHWEGFVDCQRQSATTQHAWIWKVETRVSRPDFLPRGQRSKVNSAKGQSDGPARLSRRIPHRCSSVQKQITPEFIATFAKLALSRRQTKADRQIVKGQNRQYRGATPVLRPRHAPFNAKVIFRWIAWRARYPESDEIEATFDSLAITRIRIPRHQSSASNGSHVGTRSARCVDAVSR